MEYAKQMLSSTNPVDRRLMNIYMIKITAKMGIHLGFENNLISKMKKTMFRLPSGMKIKIGRAIKNS